MLIRKSAFVALLTTTVLASTQAVAQGVTHVQSGNWMETDFLDSANPGCSVGVDGSMPGSRMIFGVSRRRPDPANLVFRQNSWTIRRGLPISILATFDATPMRIEGIGSGNSISVDLTGETLRSWVHNLTSASILRLTFVGGTTPMWTIDLTGSSSVINAMGDCVRSHELAGVGAPFSLALAAPSAPPAYNPSFLNVPSSPPVPGGVREDEPPPAPIQPSYLPSSPFVPGGARVEPPPSPAPVGPVGPATFSPSTDPVFAAWSGSSNMQSRPFHADGPWELQWINDKGFFAITVHALRSQHGDLVANTTNAGQSSHFYPDGGDFYLEVESSNGWQIRAVSIVSAAPSAPISPPPTPAPAPMPAPPQRMDGLSPPSADPSVVGVQQGDQLPKDEAAFIAAAQNGQQSYNATSSDFAQGASRPARKQAICRALPSPVVSGWVGKLETLTTNGDGKGVISIEISPDVHLKTWNNDLSDIGDRTLIDPGSTVYRAMSSLRPGQMVRFSGRLVASETDCYQESSITLRGSMTAPEFLIRFDQIEGL